MSPLQIQLVRACWARAMREPGQLVTAITSCVTDELAGDEADSGRLEAITWMVETVDHLIPALDHPTTLSVNSTSLIRRRMPVTLGELAADRTLLMCGLDRQLGGLTSDERHAWMLATDLFGELVADVLIDPFAEPA
jgi:hypothetical protein